LCKTFRLLPDDPAIEDMNPMLRAWMFYSWLEDYGDEFKLLENQSYLIGSFINPEAVRKMLGEGQKQYETSTEDFDKLTEELFRKHREQDANIPKRRRKRKIEE